MANAITVRAAQCYFSTCAADRRNSQRAVCCMQPTAASKTEKLPKLNEPELSQFLAILTVPISVPRSPYWSTSLHCALANGAVYCNRSCLCVCGGRVGGRCLLPQLEIPYIDLHQTGSVGESGDHLQVIKLWPSRAPGKGVCGGAKILALPYYSQRAVFASLWALFHS